MHSVNPMGTSSRRALLRPVISDILSATRSLNLEYPNWMSYSALQKSDASDIVQKSMNLKRTRSPSLDRMLCNDSMLSSFPRP